MTTRTLSLFELYRRCVNKAVSLPAGHEIARKRLYEAAEAFRDTYDELYGDTDDEGPVGCQVDQSWL